METKDGTLTGIGGLQLYYQGWLPDGMPKATVFLCHGLAEHGGRYAHLGEYLAGRGFAMWALDYRGHGRSEGLRGYVERFDLFAEDMCAFVTHIGPTGKTFMYGHSMGSTIALHLAQRFPEMLDGLVLSGTVLEANEGIPRLLVGVSKLLSAAFPWLPILTLESAVLSHDPEVNAAYDNDPLVYRGKIRARLGAEILRVGAKVKASLGEVTLPVLIMHGVEDCLADLADSEVVYAQIGSEDKTFKLWEGMYHEIHNEPAVKDELLALVAGWLEARL
jgi:acylglycerol lipase